MIVTAGKTNVSVYYYIVQDASATSPGEPVTGLLFSDIETGGSASYVRQGAARTDLTLITLASASATHADGGFILVDDTNMPGLYRCDYPDAAFATGVDQVFLQIVVASANNAVAAPILVDITDVDLRDSVRGGMTALPNAAADGAGGLPISDAGGLDLDGRLDADVSSRLAPTTASRTLDVTAAGNAGIDWNNIENPTTAQNLSSTNIDPDQVVASVTGAAGSVTGAVGSVTGAVGSVAGNVDGNVTGSVGSNLELGPTEVLAQVNAALDTAIAELGVAAPAITPTLRTGLMLMYMAMRNKVDVDTTGTDAMKVHNDAGTQITSKLVTDDGTDYSEAKMT